MGVEGGGVPRRPVEVFYGDNASKPETGVAAIRRFCNRRSGRFHVVAAWGSYAPDDIKHAHTPLAVVGSRGGKPAVIASE